jgi:lipopolysaccharide heptosyltransferase II
VRVLIVLPGALGDVVRALPLLGRLRRARPTAHVAWVVEPPSAPVLDRHPWLDAVHVFDRPRGVRALVPLLRRLRAERFDTALDLGRGVKSAWIAWASGARLRIGFGPADGREGGWLFANRRLPPQGTARAKLEQFLAFGDVLDLPPAPVEFGLAPTAAEAAALLGDLGRPLVAASLGSSCSSRYWFPDRTAAVLRALAERRRAAAVLLGTAADAPFARDVAARTAGVRDLTGRTTLRQLLAVVARADVAFGPDSGALHLAAALGRPVVSLWGATSARRSAPFGSEGRAVEGASACRPCFLRSCPIERVCMRAIDVETVCARVEEALAA